MLNATFSTPDLDSFCLLDRLGLTVTGQHVADDHTVLRCRVVAPEDPVERDCWCHRCGAAGVARDTVVRTLAHVPVGWRPTMLHVAVVSNRARASELLGAAAGDVDRGQQPITVVRKGSRALQPLPASPDASCGCGCIRRSWAASCPPGGISRCGGRCAVRCGR